MKSTKPSTKRDAVKSKSARPLKGTKAAVKATKAALKAAPKPKAKPATNGKASAVKRRDGAGHLDPKYARELRALSDPKPREDDRAFLKSARSRDSLTQERGEEYVMNATTGEDEGGRIRDEAVAEEVGGPFVITSAGTEFARGTDASNPRRASREPFPRT